MHGATIIKPVETDTIINCSREDSDKHLSLNYDDVDTVLEINRMSFLKFIKPIVSHFNYVHCGVEICSMSKLVMNKVIT